MFATGSYDTDITTLVETIAEFSAQLTKFNLSMEHFDTEQKEQTVILKNISHTLSNGLADKISEGITIVLENNSKLDQERRKNELQVIKSEIKSISDVVDRLGNKLIGGLTIIATIVTLIMSNQ